MNGCGHSFHMECLIPDISDCPLYKQTIASFIEELSDKANDSVFNLDDTEEKEATDDQLEDEASNEQDDEVEVGTSVTDELRFSAIVNSIWSWERPIVHMSWRITS